jgi:hypothetical protein
MTAPPNFVDCVDDSGGSEAAALLAELRAAGIRLTVDGDRLVARGRRLPPDLAPRLRGRKAELVALLTAPERPHNPQNAAIRGAAGNCVDSVDESGGSDPAEPHAWRLYSRRLGRELWVYRDPEALGALERDGLDGLPAVHGDDLPQLRAFTDRRLADVLDALAVWAGSRVVADAGEPLLPLRPVAAARCAGGGA